MDLRIFPLKSLSEEEIIKNNYDLNKLWMVSHESQVYGPYLEEELRSFLLLDEHKDHFLTIQLCNLQDEKWTERNQCSFLNNKQIYFLHPENTTHNYSEIAQLFKDKKLSSESQISLDNGSTFKALKDIPDFYFITKKNFNLPDFLDGDDLFYDKTLQIKINEKKQKEDPITKLVANVNQSKSQQTQIIQMTKAAVKQTSISMYALVLIFLGSAFTGYKFYNYNPPQKAPREIQSVQSSPTPVIPTKPIYSPPPKIQQRIPANVDIDGVEIKEQNSPTKDTKKNKDTERIISVLKEIKNSLPEDEHDESEDDYDDDPEEEEKSY